MPRGSSSAAKTQAARRENIPLMFYDGEFVSGHLYFWTGPGKRTWNGHEFLNLGKLMGISSIGETGGLRAEGIACTLSGVPNDLVMKALTECRHAKKGTLWFGFLAPDNTIVCDPDADKLFIGELDVATLHKGAKTSTIAITYENAMLDRRPRVRRYTHEDQQLDYPGDLGLEYINGLMTLDLNIGTSGSGSGSGQAPFCFSLNTRVHAFGWVAEIGALPTAGVAVMTHAGPRWADVEEHDFSGEMIDMGGGELVTLKHLIRIGQGLAIDSFWPAERHWPDAPRVHYCGKVRNLRIHTTLAEERHFLLANGETAHNLKAIEPVGE